MPATIINLNMMTNFMDKEIDRMLGQYANFLDIGSPESSFKQVAKGLQIVREFARQVGNEELVKRSEHYLRRYFSILEHSKHFREHELNHTFPHGADLEVYVDQCHAEYMGKEKGKT